MKKHLSLLLALLMLAPAAVSCAETEDPAAPASDPTVSAEPAAEETVPEETEISRENYPDTLPELDFGGETVVPLIRKYSNLAVVQTFSKSRSLAGARLGFTIAPKEIIAAMETLRYSTNPYNVNRLTLLAGQAAMEDEDYFQKNRHAIMDARAWTKAALEERGFVVTDSMTNFLFARSDRIDGGELYTMLKDKGVLVRHFTSARICQYNRITVGTMAEMETLVEKIDEIFSEKGV